MRGCYLMLFFKHGIVSERREGFGFVYAVA